MPILEESPRKKFLPPPVDVQPALLGFLRNDHQNPTPHPVDAAPPPQRLFQSHFAKQEEFCFVSKNQPPSQR